MKITTKHATQAVVVGHGTELWTDLTRATVWIHANHRQVVLLDGTPRELRKLARSITEMLRQPRRK